MYSNCVRWMLSSAQRTSTAYDATLREVATTNQDGTFGLTAYEPLLTRSFDENQTDPTNSFYGNSIVHYTDGLGRLVRVHEVTHLTADVIERSTLNSRTTPS